MICVCVLFRVCMRNREPKGVQYEFWGAHNGRRREEEMEKERGRPASKTLDLHEKKHVDILLLTSAASITTKSGCLLFTDSFRSTILQTAHALNYIFK